jgi:subtilisin family serine protease
VLPPTVPPFAQEALDRHHSRLLQPATAVLLAGQHAPLPTAYRAGVLMLPDSARRAGSLHNLNKLLADAGVYLDDSACPKEFDENSQQTRPVAIRLLRGAAPATMDAWLILQTLRAALARGDQRADQASIGGIGLDHLMIGSALAGAGGELVGTNWATEGSGDEPGPSTGGDHGYVSRLPVDLAMPVPTFTPQPGGPRPPVVVVLDSGIGTHPWFTDGFLRVRANAQAAVVAVSANNPGPAITGPEDGPVTDEPLIGALASHYGHGTFIAGIIRQIAPMAQVSMVRVMHSDGIAYESELMAALESILADARRRAAGDLSAEPVDVLSLSLGYFHEEGETLSAHLLPALDELSALGVVVVAAAGNFATHRPFYPAAFAPRYAERAGAPLLSVGALNPNASVALFSDDGPWVNCFATGAAVVSTFPVTAEGSRQPDYSVGDGARQGLDLDDYASGFAVWSGTSFAAPAVAAHVATALYQQAGTDPGLGLDTAGADAAVRRARQAVQSLGG